MSIRNKLVAGGIAAALLGGGALATTATAASAATAAPATVMSYQVKNLPSPSPDVLSLKYLGNTYNYNVKLHRTWVQPGVWLISGHLTDTYEPQAINLPVHGVQFGSDVVFSVQYPTAGPDAGSQGVRTFSGVIDPVTHQVTGNWSETGTEAGSGPFTLAHL